MYTATDPLAIPDAPNGNDILMADIDLSGYDWTPYATIPKRPFTGVFEGNGHVISSPKGVNGSLFSYTAAGNSGAENPKSASKNASIHAQYENRVDVFHIGQKILFFLVEDYLTLPSGSPSTFIISDKSFCPARYSVLKNIVKIPSDFDFILTKEHGSP